MKKNQFTIAFFVMLLSMAGLSVSASTLLTGTINKDSVLEVANSPYLVTSSLLVQPGVELTVPDDVILKFSDGVNFYVYGTLNATNAKFTSENESPSPGDWGYLVVGNYSDSAFINLDDCQVEYFKSVQIHPNGVAQIEGTILANSGDHGVTVDFGAVLQMTGGSVETTSSDATSYYSGIYTDNESTINLSGTTIQGYQYGICLDNNPIVSFSDITITSCEYPINFGGPAVMKTTGNSTFLGNTYNCARVNFGVLNSDWTLPYLPIPYLFGGFEVRPTSKLIISSGNILKFYYYLNMNGILKAVATPGEMIYFTSAEDDNWGGDTNNDGTSTAPAASSWNGVYFNDQSMDTACIMRRCAVRYAGSQYGGHEGIYAGNVGAINTYNASPTIDSCELSNNYIGVYMEGLSNPVLTNTTIGSSTLTPMAMSFEADPVLSNNVLSLSDNKYDAIGIIPGTMQGNAHLIIRSMTDLPNMTYFLMGDVTVPAGKTLTIDKGITIKAYRDESGIYSYQHKHLLVYGSLVADGTADSLINFTSVKDDNYGSPADCNNDGTITSPEIGDWGGFIFMPGSMGLMNYCRIKYANIYYQTFQSCDNTYYIDNTAIAIIDADPVISNCEFKDLNHAVFCYRSADPVLENLDMVNITYTPINISCSASPTMSGITFTNVGWSAMGLIGGPVCLDGTIKQLDVAGYTNISYVLLYDMIINSGSNISVDPGVVIKSTKYEDYYSNDHYNGYYYYYYDNDSRSSIYVDGGFRVLGTTDAPVVFSSISDDNVGNPSDTNGDGDATSPAQNDWGTIKYRSTSSDAFNVIDHALIKYAGATGEGCVTFENAAGILKNSTLSDSYYYGAYINGNSTPEIDSVTLQNCRLDPVAMSLTSDPVFSDITFTSNASKAIQIIEGTLSSNAVLVPRSLAGIDNIAYIVDRLTISQNAKLTILPGVVIKFRTESYPWITYIKNYGNLIAEGEADNKIYLTSYKDDSKGGDSNNNGNTDAPEPGDWGQYWSSDASGGIMFLNNTTKSDTVNVLKNCELSYPTLGVRVENAHATIDSCIIQLCANYGISSLGSANPDISYCNFYNIQYTPVELSLFSSPTFSNCSALNVGYMALAVVPETFSKSGTVPVRSFAGYENINYLMERSCTVNSGCKITIPAGLVFKSVSYLPSSLENYNSYSFSDIAYGFNVNGCLEIKGTTDKPVVFTHACDDTYGFPADMNMDGSATVPPVPRTYDNFSGTWLTFNDISADSSSIDCAVFRYAWDGIYTQSASPSIRNSLFEKLCCGIEMKGVSEPAIDSCTFNNLYYYPMQISLVAYPVSTLGNVISGTTYKVIKVGDETLTQNVILQKRNFGGKTNVPYLFGNYQIGTSASLTIQPGVICKFQRPDYNYWGNSYWFGDAGLFVSKGLKAVGGATADSTIIFTSFRDDFYGGDSNADSSANSPSAGDWNGLSFLNVSLDPECVLKNCIIRYADNGVLTTSSNPTIDSTVFNRNTNGINAMAASNPILTGCDFNENTEYAVKNTDKSFTIQATDCWWGSNSGPIVDDVATDNSVEQEYITSEVAYEPWKTTGIQNPLTGDVSLNGLVQAYDASLVLKQTVELITLSDKQLAVADVSGNGNISAYDASLILKYVVGLDSYFPVNKVVSRSLGQASVSDIALNIPDVSVTDIDTFTVTVSAYSLNGISGADLKIDFDPACLQIVSVKNLITSMTMESNIDNEKGSMLAGLAGSSLLNSNEEALLELTFVIKTGESTETTLHIEKFLANEEDLTSQVHDGYVTINRIETALLEPYTRKTGMDPIYPNPYRGSSTLVYHLNSTNSVTIDVFNLSGQKLIRLVETTNGPGTYSVSLTDKNIRLDQGIYYIQMKSDGISQTQTFQISK